MTGQTVALEGFHAVKHALRFGATLHEIRATDPVAALALAERLAPDVLDALRRLLREAPVDHPTGVAASAEKNMAASVPSRGRIVVLEDPRRAGNVGAVVRVAAAAGAVAVLTTGDADPWSNAAVRGSAGLHFALPVARVDAPPDDRPLIALDPDGDPNARIPAHATLAFGTERDGLSAELLARADARIALPMRPGVSSLNLATAVAATLYSR